MENLNILTDPVALAALVVWLLPLLFDQAGWFQQLAVEGKRAVAIVLSAIVALLCLVLAHVLGVAEFSLNAFAILVFAVATGVLNQIAFGFWKLTRVIK